MPLLKVLENKRNQLWKLKTTDINSKGKLNTHYILEVKSIHLSRSHDICVNISISQAEMKIGTGLLDY